MANSATRMLLPRNGNSLPLHLLRAAPIAAGALSSVPYLKPNPETRKPSFLTHLPINDSLFCRNDSLTEPVLDWRRAEAATRGKEEKAREEIGGERTDDLEDVRVFSDDDSDCDFDSEDDDDDEYEDEDSE